MNVGFFVSDAEAGQGSRGSDGLRLAPRSADHVAGATCEMGIREAPLLVPVPGRVRASGVGAAGIQ
jgi:hypothetical protein